MMAEVDTDKRFNCSDCQDEKMISMDCDGNKETPTRVPIFPRPVHRFYTYRCPMALIYDFPESLNLWDEFTKWKCLKVLPVFGGTDDQDPRLMEAFQLFASVMNKVEFDDGYMKWKSNKNKAKDETPKDAPEKKYNSFRDIKNKRMGKG